MLKRIAIDLLLRWAFTVELPKGNRVEASAWELMARAAIARVAGAPHGGGMGFVPGEPHDDALALAEAVRKLSTRYQLGRDRVARLCGDYAALDLLAVSAVGGAPFNLAALIIRGAVLKVFEWDIGEPTPQPMRREENDLPIVFGTNRNTGELVVAVSDRKSRRYPPHLTDLHCPIVWNEPSVAELAETRAEYAAWHDALLMVADAAALSEHVALAPSVSAEPWCDAKGAAQRKLLPVGDLDAVRPILPLAPRRAPALPPLRSDAVIMRMNRACLKIREAAQKRRTRNPDEMRTLHSI